jgi:hypothetical protein
VRVDRSAIEAHYNHLQDLAEEGLADRELEDLSRDPSWEDLGIHLADLGFVEDLEADLGYILHLVVEGCKEHENHHDRLDCRLYRLASTRRRVELVDMAAVVVGPAGIRIEDVAADDSREEDQEVVEGEEESCIAVRQPLV